MVNSPTLLALRARTERLGVRITETCTSVLTSRFSLWTEGNPPCISVARLSSGNLDGYRKTEYTSDQSGRRAYTPNYAGGTGELS